MTHFPLTINYDTRLQEHPELIPPGLPTGGQTGYNSLAALLWKDCGSDPKCRVGRSAPRSALPEPIRIDDTSDAQVICHTRASGLL